MKYLFLFATLLFTLVFAVVPEQAQTQYPNGGYYGQSQNWRGALSSHDQEEFDKYYSKWVNASRKNDHDDVAEAARHMQEIMTSNRIPANVPFDQIASNASAYPAPANGAYPNGAYPNPASGAYPYPANGQPRLSADDQRDFDKAYTKWIDAQRKNDQDDVNESARKMQEIMGRYNIPANVPYSVVATNGYTAAPNGAAPYAYGQSAQRLSEKDQKEFDEAYRHWADARRKKDMDDVDKNARKMQEIMARYNIPANVSFDQIATPGSAYR